MVQVVGNVLAVVLAVVLTASVVMHAVVDPPWWRTGISRHLMAFMASFAAVAIVTAVRVISGSSLDTPWFAWLRVVVFATAPVVAVWRLAIQVRLHRQAREAHRRKEPLRLLSDPPDRGPGRVLTMSMEDRAMTTEWWRDLLARIGRQEAQTLLPVLAAAAMSGGITGINYLAVVSVAGFTALVTLARAVSGFRASPTAPLWVQALDRAAAAFAGTLLGLITTGPGFDILHAPWASILDVSLAAAVLGVVTMFTNPPLSPAAQNADGSYRIGTGR